MLYQNLVVGDTPYHLYYSTALCSTGFPNHRHPEAEFIYCFEGSFEILIERVPYTVTAGSLVLISPMNSHELLKSDASYSRMVIEVGPSLLKQHFDIFSKTHFTSPVVTPDSNIVQQAELKQLIEETARLKQENSEYSKLIITGNIYKICGIIMSQFTKISEEFTKKMYAVANIERALELVYNHYNEPITVDMAANLTGYGKSNFCKLFKRIVGTTFHNFLNCQRIEKACIYLEETTMPIAEIASTVGFSETKSFCRVFKNITGITPMERRKNRNQN